MNKQKDRLVELLIKGNNQPCGNGGPWEDDYCKGCEYEGKKDCRVLQLADYLLANGVIVPPCKVGDKVWDNDFGRPCSYIVTGFDIGKTLDDEENHRELFMYYENSNGSVQCNCPITQIGKTVFLTKEEAEEALKGGVQG